MADKDSLNQSISEDREAYILEVLSRKIAELKDVASKNPRDEQQHHHGTDFQRGMSAGFISGIGFATRILDTEGSTYAKVLTLLEEYNIWAQEFNRSHK
ncbi:hypothetical protein [Desulforamulus aquiferis]|uniref:Uncharacterized protein n=1 Tax=Desulforamulus aquiferis TaxID=1397668 RepID=A0AAW7Z9M2_9FIRM|nr:hypothetical protein [Desulforamulus aquiferis]MDO7785781.1 hypothetical protein [Desulforamulus aquiferis]RYD06706.1 hypothetical protein N752_03260 [Desulforamulus aquiferis]